MTTQDLPEWAVPGTPVLIHTGGTSTSVTRATITRVSGQSAWVSSPAWAKGYERRFVPRRNAWQSASVAQMEEHGGRNSGFNSAKLLCPEDSDHGRALLAKLAFHTTSANTIAAAQAFSRRPSRQAAEQLRAALTEYMEVVP